MWDAEWMAITIFHDNKDGQIWEWPFFMISHLWTSLLGKIVKSVTFSDSQSGWSTVRFDRSIRPCTGRTSWYDYPFSIAFRSTSISFKYIFRYTSYFWGLVEILTLNSSNHEQFSCDFTANNRAWQKTYPHMLDFSGYKAFNPPDPTKRPIEELYDVIWIVDKGSWKTQSQIIN